MAFGISGEIIIPEFKPDFSPADRQINYGRIVDLIGQYLPLPIKAVVTYVESTKVATCTAETPAHGTASYQWAASTTKDGTYNNIDSATSATFTATSAQSEKYLGCKVTNTLNGITTTTLVKYGQLPTIS